MNLDKKISLWRKLRIKYEYHWMDRLFPFQKVIAPPTWFLTHNAHQIDQRVAAYNAEMKQFYEERHQIVQKIKELQQQMLEEEHDRLNR